MYRPYPFHSDLPEYHPVDDQPDLHFFVTRPVGLVRVHPTTLVHPDDLGRGCRTVGDSLSPTGAVT